MGTRKNLPFLLLLLTCAVYAQDRPIKIVTEEIPNRLALYAVNENEQDFDVMVKVSGTNFRQSRGKPRLIRVPATSKVHLKTLMLMRGKTPSYTYELTVNDSLSRRALKKEFETIKIHPKKRITVYIPEFCVSCDSIIAPLEQGKYKFLAHELGSNPEMKEQLQRSFGSATPIDSLRGPIFNLGGKLYTRIDSYDKLLDELKKE